MVATTTKLASSIPPSLVLTEEPDDSLDSLAIPSLRVHTFERVLDGTRRNRCSGTDNADNRLTPRYLVQAFELAIEDLFVPLRQETSSVPTESPFGFERGLAEVRQQKTAVPKSDSVAREIVRRNQSSLAVAPTGRLWQDEPAWINRLRKTVFVGCMALATILLIGSTRASCARRSVVKAASKTTRH